MASDTNFVSGDKFFILEATAGTNSPVTMDIKEKVLNFETVKSNLAGSNAELESDGDLCVFEVNLEDKRASGSNRKLSDTIITTRQQTKVVMKGRQSVLELDSVPLWGFTSICGRRQEMEDAVAILPQFLRIPAQMVMGDPVPSNMSQASSYLTGHFFGIYDGHGGNQVANYCRDRIHWALAEEIEMAKDNMCKSSIEDVWQAQWEKTFSNCFLKVDAEVGGIHGGRPGCDTNVAEVNFPPVAAETVGSTAVVAIVCPTHLIVANCGDSRAVLCRGKVPVPLSVDHKPNRNDEHARIEAAGGKVIQWNGFRVFGVLAMSRSIGDRCLKPWIIPDPEVLFVPRKKEDVCLVLASDGLWDVMTNEEVCNVARRQIHLWHKKNGGTLPAERKEGGVDPAAQAAAEYLTRLALGRGSRDNVTIVVVDLKAQKKFKSKT